MEGQKGQIEGWLWSTACSIMSIFPRAVDGRQTTVIFCFSHFFPLLSTQLQHLGLRRCTLSPTEWFSCCRRCRCIFPSSSSRIFPCSYHEPLTLSLMQQLLADTTPQLQPVALPAFTTHSKNKGIVNPAESLVQNARTSWEKACERQECNFIFLYRVSRLFENCVSLVLWEDQHREDFHLESQQVQTKTHHSFRSH